MATCQPYLTVLDTMKKRGNDNTVLITKRVMEKRLYKKKKPACAGLSPMPILVIHLR